MVSSPILMGGAATVVLAAALMAANFVSVEAVIAIIVLAASVMVLVYPWARMNSFSRHLILAIDSFPNINL